MFSHADEGKADQPGADAVLNPLEFYGVERVQQVIEHWLMRHLLAGYPFVVRNVPKALRSNGNDRVMDRPLVAGAERDGVLQAIEKSACNNQTRQALQQAIERLALLDRCRVCGAQSTVWDVSHMAFKATCRGCKNEVTWQKRNGSAAYRSGETGRPFEEVGHLAMRW